MIQNCTLQNSMGRALVLTEISENLKINHCSFLFNKYYEGHGTAIYFSTSNNLQNQTQLVFTINNSNFNENEGSDSIVYIDPSEDNSQILFLNYSVFSDNQGSSLYILHQNLFIAGNVTFDNNTATCGAGIVASNQSTITFSENSVVIFIHNAANSSGGAIFLSHFSSAIFGANSLVIFNSNTANQYYGGSIYSYNNSNIVFKGNCSVQFNKNRGKFGGALHIGMNSTFTIEVNSSVIFNSNVADLRRWSCLLSRQLYHFVYNKFFPSIQL